MSSSSKTANSTTNESTTNDERAVADNGANIIRAENGGLVNITDGGAIDMAATVAADAFESAEGFGALASKLSLGSLDLARDSIDRTNAAFDNFADKTRTDQSQFFDQLIKFGIPAVVLIFIAKGFFK